jgi:hypothetical protein
MSDMVICVRVVFVRNVLCSRSVTKVIRLLHIQFKSAISNTVLSFPACDHSGAMAFPIYVVHNVLRHKSRSNAGTGGVTPRSPLSASQHT